MIDVNSGPYHSNYVVRLDFCCCARIRLFVLHHAHTAANYGIDEFFVLFLSFHSWHRYGCCCWFDLFVCAKHIIIKCISFLHTELPFSPFLSPSIYRCLFLSLFPILFFPISLSSSIFHLIFFLFTASDALCVVWYPSGYRSSTIY